jgi:hypothetical protein
MARGPCRPEAVPQREQIVVPFTLRRAVVTAGDISALVPPTPLVAAVASAPQERSLSENNQPNEPMDYLIVFMTATLIATYTVIVGRMIGRGE